MKERKQKTLAKRLLVAMLSVMMAVTFIPTSLLAYAAEPEATPDDVQSDVQTEVVQDDVQTTEEPQAETTEPVTEEATEATKATEAQQKDAEPKEEVKEDEPEKELTKHYSKELDEVIVDVDTEEGAFDEEVSLKVKPLAEGSKQYEKAEKALADNKQVYSGMLAFDIHFENSKGKEVEPNGTVSVKMTAKKEALKAIAPDAFDADTVQITHIGDKATEVVADTDKASKIEGTIDVEIEKKAVKKIDAEFDVDQFSTFTLTWKNGEATESATIHFIETNEGGTFTELGATVSLDTSAASVSLSTDFPDVAEKEYRFVGGYYSPDAVTNPANDEDTVNIGATLTKNADGTWQCKPADGSAAITIANGSHIYASYKQFTKAGTTPSGSDASKIKPDSIKNVKDNGDGTYTVRLDINGHQVEEKKGANILLVFDRTSSMSNSMGTGTRFAAAKAAVHTLVNALDPGTNPINMAAMSFARTADATYAGWTTSGTTITNFTDGLELAASGSTPGAGGTNWEAAFAQAKVIINNISEADKAKPTFLVFLTDGNPTIYVGSNTIRNATAESLEYTRALTEASGLNSSIPIYGVLCANAADGPLLNTLMTDLATSTYGSHTTNYVLADNEATLTQTFQAIGQAVLDSLGASQASTNDGVTALSTTSATAGAAGAFKYYKTPRPAGMADTAIIPEENLVPWSGAPAASYSASTGVTWDLESVGTLEDNTSYTLEFTVWPSQAAYDLIADLNNGLKVYEAGHDNSITDAERLQVYESGGKYYLRTNTNFDTSYSFQNNTYNDEGITQTTGSMVLPTETIDIEKIWNNLLDQNDPPDKAVLVLTKDGENYLAGDNAIEVSANTDPDKNWKAEVYISLGQILQNTTDKSYQVLETGHDYEIVEPPELNKYQWELHSEIFRPMVINGKVVMLIKDASVTGTDGVDYYTIGGNKYKPATGSNSLRAWNDRRSWLQVEKKVEETTPAAPADTLFEYTITVTNANASQGKESDTASDYYVWFSAFGNGSPVKDLEVSSNVHAETGASGKTGYFYVKSGEQITVKIKAGWTLRFLNLPSGSTYNIQETSIPDGFTFVKAEGRQVVDTEAQQAAPAKPTITKETVAGTINVPNVEFYVDYTNKYEETKATFTKQWEDAGNQDGIRPDTTAYASDISLLVNGTASTKYDANRTITDNKDNTYTITYTGLPKYINGTAATYKLEETTVPTGYTVSGSPADNGGTITNTHTPKTTKVTVNKVWSDNNNPDRPTSITVTLLKKVGDQISEVQDIVLNGDNSWTKTIDNLDAFSNGAAIIYTIVEKTVTGYSTTYSGTGDDTNGYSLSGDVDNGYKGTVTNTLNTYDVKVTKKFTGLPEGTLPANFAITPTVGGEAQDALTLTDEAKQEDGSYSWTIKDVPYGTKVSATEAGTDVTGYTLGTATTPSEITVTKSGMSLDFVNPYTLNTYDVKVTKKFEGIPADKVPEDFTITPAFDGEDQTALTISGAEKSEDGLVYTWTIEEVPYGTEVSATEDGTDVKGYTLGEATIPEAITVTGEGQSLDFVNPYTPVPPGTVFIDPPVQKIVKGSAPKKAETYTFELECTGTTNENGLMPMPAAAGDGTSMTMNIKGEGKKEFGKIVFTEPGVYDYRVTEVAGSNENCEYDDTVYFVRAEVQLNEDTGKLELVSCKYYENDIDHPIDTATFKFVNTYTGGGTATGDNFGLLAGILMLMLSALGLGALILTRRRREEN